MAVTGDGSFPLNSPYYRRRRRSGSDLLYKNFEAHGTGAGKDVFQDYFFKIINSAPSVALNSPSDGATISDTTPTLDFTGTDADGDDIRYQIEITRVPTYIAGASSQGTDSSTTSAISTTGANLIVIGVASNFGDAGVPTDSSSNTWTKLTTYSRATTFSVEIFYCINPTTSGTHTFTFNSTSSFHTMMVQSFANASGGYVTENGANADGTSLATGSVTQSSVASVIASTYAINASASPMSINSGFSETSEVDFSGGVAYGGAMAYLIQTAIASVNPTWTRTNSDGQAAAIAVFSPNVVLTKTSNVDAGFSGSPDNTDPFPSGQQVSFTVQAGDALSDGVYAWRVRGLDPSGTASYGNWATPRTFTLSSSPGPTTRQTLMMMGVGS